MKYLPYICLLLLAGCASQGRGYSSAEKWERYDPEKRRPTYDETYVHPSNMSADQLVVRAKEAEQKGREDQARVDYHTAFRRDQWHPEANERYQDLMLRNGLFDTVWQEYVDLYQQHPARGDAFWYHARPMLIERADTPLRNERAPKVSEEDLKKINDLLTEGMAASDGEAMLAKVNEALAIADLPALQVWRIRSTPDDALEALEQEYAARVEDNPVSGNTIGLHALVVARTDQAAAVAELREAWILDLPGAWLRYAIAEVCTMMDPGDAIEELNANERREVRGWLRAALEFHNRFKDARRDDLEIGDPAQALTIRLSRLESSMS